MELACSLCVCVDIENEWICVIFFTSCSFYLPALIKCLVLGKKLLCVVNTQCFAWICPSHSLAPFQDVALVELGQSDSGSDEGDELDSDSDADSDSDDCSEITEQNLKLPGQSEEKKKMKINIEVVSQQGEQEN